VREGREEGEVVAGCSEEFRSNEVREGIDEGAGGSKGSML